jgi:hypothetical protein
MRPIINIEKGFASIVNELLAAGEVFDTKKTKTSPKTKKIKKSSG